ncbi:NHL repeat-containing protein [Deferribacterales bacterium Es71-Z0220]|uniref:NHL repeat-containing protein n=1 Tax=Deferrivibrio essentukiensis TaxID=2880922 RepID=UPI001F615D63|nr:NHL repeat-containing protein [Deferrivibrio essentukiensis]MCB4204424.1 NHL repeat-containing protein [Deferrivibrio essentukiensis]
MNVEKQYEIHFDKDEFVTDIEVVDSLLYILESSKNNVFFYNLYDGALKGKKNIGNFHSLISFKYFDSKWYVLSANENSLVIFDSTWKYLKTAKIDAQDPTGIAFYEDFMFIVDNDGQKVMKYKLKNLKLTQQVKGFGFNKNQFRYPFDIKVDEKGDIYVSEVINTRVQKFNTSLKYVDTIGEWGIKKGQLYRPKGIEIQGQNLFVTDSIMGVIQIFDKNSGKFLGVLGENDKILRLKSPYRLKVYNNFLCILDNFKKVVYVYKFKFK